MIPEGYNEDLIEKATNENKEFRSLYLEHLELEKKLSELNKSKFLTTERDIEKKRLQKIKLSGKDRMAKILKKY
ncbi:MAG: hypothetical protein A2889_08065 [Nitrospinae bacterium RIFCSPLOWO2_01_FULL_39_10]|nr:MAG: hypothetical protein A2889_08065 [Nitrospinae bacterium RIFCSPLOWO2_01_FULL_39_10]